MGGCWGNSTPPFSFLFEGEKYVATLELGCSIQLPNLQHAPFRTGNRATIAGRGCVRESVCRKEKVK